MCASSIPQCASIPDVSFAVVIQEDVPSGEASSGGATGAEPIPVDEEASMGEEGEEATSGEEETSGEAAIPGGETEDDADPRIQAEVYALKAAILACHYFANRLIPAHLFRPLPPYEGHPFDIKLFLKYTHYWPEIVDLASLNYKLGILGRDWFSDPRTRQQHGMQEIFAAGVRFRVTRGHLWQPEWGEHTIFSRTHSVRRPLKIPLDLSHPDLGPPMIGGTIERPCSPIADYVRPQHL